MKDEAKNFSLTITAGKKGVDGMVRMPYVRGMKMTMHIDDALLDRVMGGHWRI